MSRKVTVELKIKLVLEIDEGKDLSEILDEMDYNFTPDISDASVCDSEILDYEVK